MMQQSSLSFSFKFTTPELVTTIKILTEKIVCQENDILVNFKLSRRRSLSSRNQSIDFQSNSMDWFLYDRDLHHERVN